MMTQGQRLRLALGVALCVHAGLAAALGVITFSTGSNTTPQVVEVAILSGGGGGGGQGGNPPVAAAPLAGAKVQEAGKPAAASLLTEPGQTVPAAEATTTAAASGAASGGSASDNGTGGAGDGGAGGGSGGGQGEGSGSGTGPGAGGGSGGGSGGGQGAGTGSGTEDAGSLTASVEPYPVSVPQPAYPAAARNREIEGTVYLALDINTEGTVDAVTITGSSGSSYLDAAAKNAAYAYIFTPAKNANGRAVPFRMTYSVDFYLK